MHALGLLISSWSGRKPAKLSPLAGFSNFSFPPEPNTFGAKLWLRPPTSSTHNTQEERSQARPHLLLLCSSDLGTMRCRNPIQTRASESAMQHVSPALCTTLCPLCLRAKDTHSLPLPKLHSPHPTFQLQTILMPHTFHIETCCNGFGQCYRGQAAGCAFA